MATTNYVVLPIAQIKITKDQERELGDIAALATSIQRFGLLQDVAINPNHYLIGGYRRLKALADLGRTHVSCKICHTAEDELAVRQAEYDENTCRKDYTPSEAVARGAVIERLAKEQAEKQGHTGPKKNPAAIGSAAVVAAKAVGMKPTTYKHAKAVVAAAKANPEQNGHLVEKMDKESVGAAYAELQEQPKPKPSYPQTLIMAAQKAHALNKLKAGDGQLEALAKFHPDQQLELLKSVLKGRQTLAQAIEKGENPEPTVEEEIKNHNSAIEAFCRHIYKEAEEHIAALEKSDPWVKYQGRGQTALAKIKSCVEIMRTVKCHAACPKCDGNGCPVCLSTGRVPKAVIQTLG